MKYFLFTLMLLVCAVVCGSCGMVIQDESDAASTEVSKLSGTMYLAKNIILIPQANASSSSDQDIDQTTQISADNVLLSTTEEATSIGRLISITLADALQNELAPDMSSLLVGRWSVLNRDFQPYTGEGQNYDGVSGEIEFHDDLTYDILSGAFGIVGAWANSEEILCAGVIDMTLTATSYDLISNNILLLHTAYHAAERRYNTSYNHEIATVAMIIVKSQDELTLLTFSGNRPCGSHEPRLAILTRIEGD